MHSVKWSASSSQIYFWIYQVLQLTYWACNAESVMKEGMSTTRCYLSEKQVILLPCSSSSRKWSLLFSFIALFVFLALGYIWNAWYAAFDLAWTVMTSPKALYKLLPHKAVQHGALLTQPVFLVPHAVSSGPLISAPISLEVVMTWTELGNFEIAAHIYNSFWANMSIFL